MPGPLWRRPRPFPWASRSESVTMDLTAQLGPHAGFILGAYGFTALVIAGLILNAWRDRRAQNRALAALEAGRTPPRP